MKEELSELTFIDVNVFMYAAGKPHPYKEPCVQILSDVENGILSALINTEIFQELLYRYYHIKLAEKGVELCRHILQLQFKILPITEMDIRLAIDLFDSLQNKGLKPRDAIHAATMKNNDINKIISADRDFDSIDFVQRIDPLNYKYLHEN
ncbi:MAG TPA: type II toxin-antitoxin system VapC family toxin [bacterium]